ncbi:CLE22p like [Actinidia chinensis var. chinensis]|uniref:CLE22p like n=1 Tax=Actinidia chinensis var. chinensis TaxID=1590841 RepID=A0A2R6QVG6_ACTCC|nr:CLE22p like [Actinidia chinensis var. chinensis]
MTRVLRKKHMGGIRKEVACLSLLLVLMLIDLETCSCFAEGGHIYNEFKGGSDISHEMNSPIKTHKDLRGNVDGGGGGGGGGVFGAEKRKVYTGPNPLHNR